MAMEDPQVDVAIMPSPVAQNEQKGIRDYLKSFAERHDNKKKMRELLNNPSAMIPARSELENMATKYKGQRNDAGRALERLYPVFVNLIDTDQLSEEGTYYDFSVKEMIKKELTRGNAAILIKLADRLKGQYRSDAVIPGNYHERRKFKVWHLLDKSNPPKLLDEFEQDMADEAATLQGQMVQELIQRSGQGETRRYLEELKKSSWKDALVNSRQPQKLNQRLP